MLRLAEVTFLERRAPNRVRVLVDFGREWPELVDNGVHLNDDFARAFPDAAAAYVAALLDAYRAATSRPDLLLQEGRARLALEPADLEAAVRAYLEEGAWSLHDWFSLDAVRYTLAFFQDARFVPDGIRAEAVADPTLLHTALAETTGGQAAGPAGRAPH